MTSMHPAGVAAVTHERDVSDEFTPTFALFGAESAGLGSGHNGKTILRATCQADLPPICPEARWRRSGLLPMRITRASS